MTEDEKRELIADARRFASSSPLGKPLAREMDKAILTIRRLSDALEGELTEPEWEYGMQDDYGLSRVGNLAASRDHAMRQDPELNPRPVRRRKAGPWMTLEGGESNG